MIKNYDGIIFDLDGVLINTEDMMYSAVKSYLLEKHQIEFEKVDFNLCFNFLGEYFWGAIQRRFGLDVSINELRDEIVPMCNYGNLKIKDGASDLINFVKNSNIKTALATNSSGNSFDKKMQLLNKDWFDYVVNCEDIKPKPMPDMHLKIAKELSLDLKKAAIIEDNETGLMAASGTGAEIIFVPNKFIINPSGLADNYGISIFNDLSEVLLYFKK